MLPNEATDAAAADDTQPPVLQTAAEIQPAAIESEIQRIESSEELSADDKTKLTAIYKQALDAARQVEKHRAQIEQYNADIQSVPVDFRSTRERLNELAANPNGAPLPESSLNELELLLANKESEVSQLQQSKARWDAMPTTRANRRVEISKRITEIKERLAEVERQLTATAAHDTPAARANRLLHLARQAELTSEAASLEKEIQNFDARNELLPLRQQRAQKELEREQRIARQLREKVAALRAAEVQRVAEEAQCEAAAAHPAVRGLAEEIARLAQHRVQLTEQIKQTKEEAHAAQQRLAKLKDERQRTEDRIDRTGLNATFGALLSKQRDMLPNRRDLLRNIAAHTEQIDQIKLAQYELLDKLKRFPDQSDEAESYLSSLRSNPENAELMKYLEAELLGLLARRREINSNLLRDYDLLFNDIVSLDGSESELLAERDAFVAFIDQRVLWLPNMPALAIRDATSAWGALAWLARPDYWLELWQAVAGDAARRPLVALGFVISLVTLVVLYPHLRGYVSEVGTLAAKGSFDRFMPTLTVAAATAALAVLAPWVLAFLAWRIANLDTPAQLAVPCAIGLSAVALVVLVAEVCRQICRPDGLAESHFAWAEATTAAIRKHILRLIGPLCLVVFLVAAMSALEDDPQAASLGRLAFVIGMLAATAPLYRMLHPRHGLLRDFLAWHRDGWAFRLRYVWFLGGVLVPPTLALLAVCGYYYTSLELTSRVFSTLCFAAGLGIARELVLRALLIARRRLAMEQARQRRAAARAAAEAAAEAGEDAGVGESQAVVIDEPLLDLSAISGQTRRLVRAVLVMTALVAGYAIWVDVLPALAVLDRIVLWPTESGDAITLKSALFAVLIGMLTFVAWKNIPGLLEIAVLQQLPLEASGRFAIATLTSYFIAVIGTVLTFNQIGIGWQNVQWLVAAMTVGLGFGLQEIFANFVSGLIILFERPIRVGDVLTVGDVTGAVTRIRVRATTITNWDRKELIIPNKEFVTGRVMNWTLSDQVNRVTINVGVAYGTDAAVVLEILQQVASEHPAILADPAPIASFEQFGPSSLDFVLRAYLPSLDLRLKTITELHQAIQRRFAEADIEIAFPQQDIHVRSIDAAMPFLARLAG